jgi:type II secretory pathway component PulK
MKEVNFKKGVALILAMFILVFIAILVVAFLELLTSDLVIANNHLGRLQALYIADAGVEHAISLLRASGNQQINTGSITFPGPGSSYTVTKSPTSRIIQSVGQVGTNKFTATIQARVSIQGIGSPYTVRIVSFQETG